jgi:hypothetical protein
MARMIDADNLAEGLKYHYQPTDQECDFDRQWAVGYNAGLNRALYSIAYARTIEPKHEWISVKDRLPEVGQKVLVCDVDPDSDYGIKVLSLECDEKGTYWDDGDGWWFEPEDMSHWMPLPEPPERE